MSLWLSDSFGDITTANQAAKKMCSFPAPNAICDTINGAWGRTRSGEPMHANDTASNDLPLARRRCAASPHLLAPPHPNPRHPHPLAPPTPSPPDIAVDANGDVIMIVRKGSSDKNAKMLKIPAAALQPPDPNRPCPYESERLEGAGPAQQMATTGVWWYPS
jgi:hypothetical protein